MPDRRPGDIRYQAVGFLFVVPRARPLHFITADDRRLWALIGEQVGVLAGRRLPSRSTCGQEGIATGSIEQIDSGSWFSELPQ